MYNFSCLENVVGTRALPLHFHEMIYFCGRRTLYIFYFRLSLKGVLWKCEHVKREERCGKSYMFNIKCTLICVVLQRAWMRRTYVYKRRCNGWNKNPTEYKNELIVSFWIGGIHVKMCQQLDFGANDDDVEKMWLMHMKHSRKFRNLWKITFNFHSHAASMGTFRDVIASNRKLLTRR